ncbi:hypothetical protein GCM10010439_23180 [Actinocorallia aurantiaca]|uniref:Uncharacterized protein n=1 Tax=Actinocorallia aurantiaca TaxID=46204 RepID=A0ABN3U5V4_9ACTN
MVQQPGNHGAPGSGRGMGEGRQAGLPHVLCRPVDEQPVEGAEFRRTRMADAVGVLQPRDEPVLLGRPPLDVVIGIRPVVPRQDAPARFIAPAAAVGARGEQDPGVAPLDEDLRDSPGRRLVRDRDVSGFTPALENLREFGHVAAF